RSANEDSRPPTAGRSLLMVPRPTAIRLSTARWLRHGRRTHGDVAVRASSCARSYSLPAHAGTSDAVGVGWRRSILLGFEHANPIGVKFRDIVFEKDEAKIVLRAGVEALYPHVG